jgi:hypothetical protein
MRRSLTVGVCAVVVIVGCAFLLRADRAPAVPAPGPASIQPEEVEPGPRTVVRVPPSAVGAAPRGEAAASVMVILLALEQFRALRLLQDSPAVSQRRGERDLDAPAPPRGPVTRRAAPARQARR